jgi:exodeoxyribonuclease VII large subunit
MVGSLGVDCAVLIRGGGSKADLVAFDSRRVSEAVARSPVPVITGLGHEIDLSIADQVAHTRTKTPTQAAEHLIGLVRSAEQTVAGLASGLQRAGSLLLGAVRSSVSGVEARLRLARFRVQTESGSLSRLAELLGRTGRRRLELESKAIAGLTLRLASAAPRIIGKSEQVVATVAQRASGAPGARLQRASSGIDALARLCSQLGPEKTLARGFSITRDARGRVVTAADLVSVGERIETQTAQGRLTSRVEE